MKGRTILALLIVPVAVTGCSGKNDSKHRNVLFIAVDDLNTSLGCYGATHVKTPNIDRLASQGLRFERAYTNYPTCNGSRTALLSGRYPESTGVLENYDHPRIKLENEVLLPEYFRRNGYFTAAVGKVAHSPSRWAKKPILRCNEVIGFEEPEEALQQLDSFPWAASLRSDAEQRDGRIARRTVELLEEHRREPFFIAVGFQGPHEPHVAPKKYFDMYPPAKVPLPVPGPSLPPIAYRRFRPQLTDAEKQELTSHYHAVTSFLDAQVGVVLDALDRLGLRRNTIVVFWSDHGWHLGDHGGIWSKGTLLEPVGRIPLILAVPGKRSAVTTQIVETVDIYATLAELAGLPEPPGVEGSSFAVLLDDPDRPLQRSAYIVKSRDGRIVGRSIRNERYAYIEYGDGGTLLYDLDRDPDQIHNLAGGQLSEVETAMKQLLYQKTKQVTRASSSPVSSWARPGNTPAHERRASDSR